jgi:hypothetical protein
MSAEEFEVRQTTYAMVPGWVIESVSGDSLRVYAHLVHRYANQQRTCWPTQQGVADDLKVSLSTVKRAVAELVATGAIVTNRSRRDDGKLGRNSYWMPMDQRPGQTPGDRGTDLGVSGVSAAQIQGSTQTPSPGVYLDPSGNQTQEGNQKELAASLEAEPEQLPLLRADLVPEQKAPRRKPRTAIPENWDASAIAIKQAQEDGSWTKATFRTEVENFKDYHRAKGNLMADWDAAFRTWMRNAKKFAAARPRAQSRPGPVGQSFYITAGGSKVEC